MLSRQGGQHDDGLVHQLGVGRVVGLDRRIDRHPLHVAGLQGASGMGHAQALRQEQLQAVAEPPAPVAQLRALMRDLVLEIGVVHPALPSAFVREAIDQLETRKNCPAFRGLMS